MGKNVLFIGGSPCSGKSTVAEKMAKEYGAFYFKVDDHLDELIKTAAQQGNPVCRKIRQLSSDEIWMRDPEIQCREEFRIYSEIAPYLFNRIHEIHADRIITEGAAYTPEVMKNHETGSYIVILAAPEFQMTQYKKREWVSRILADCSEKEAAFGNWMQRDILFARQVKSDCVSLGIPYLMNDGAQSIDRFYQSVKDALGLETRSDDEV